MLLSEYTALAAVEDRMWYFHALHGLIEREIVRRLAAGPASGRPGPREILDAGCGTGGLIRRLAPRHPDWKWTGIDAELAACGLARQRTSSEIQHGTLAQLPFADGSFDAVVLADVLYHLADDDAALREVHRVLRPGGVIVATAPAYRWLWSYHDVAVAGRRRYGRRELLGKLQAAGFIAIRATYWNALALPLVALRRKLLPAPKSGSDVRAYSAPAELVGRTFMGIERAWLAAFKRLPFGVSIFASGCGPGRRPG